MIRDQKETAGQQNAEASGAARGVSAAAGALDHDRLGATARHADGAAAGGADRDGRRRAPAAGPGRADTPSADVGAGADAGRDRDETPTRPAAETPADADQDSRRRAPTPGTAPGCADTAASAPDTPSAGSGADAGRDRDETPTRPAADRDSRRNAPAPDATGNGARDTPPTGRPAPATDSAADAPGGTAPDAPSAEHDGPAGSAAPGGASRRPAPADAARDRDETPSRPTPETPADADQDGRRRAPAPDATENGAPDTPPTHSPDPGRDRDRDRDETPARPTPDTPAGADQAGAGAPAAPPSGRPAGATATRATGEVEDEGEGRVAEGGAVSESVSGDEPLLPARVHRPVDLMRFLFGLLGIAVVLAIAGFAHATTSGVEQDIADGAARAPEPLITFAGFTASVAVLIVPVAFAVERLIKRDGLRIADGVLAAVLAHGVSLATDLWVSDAAPAAIRDALTRDAPGGGLTDPVHGYLAPVIAYMTAVGMARRPRWRVALWCVLLLDAFAVLVGGYTTPFSIIVTVLIGWTVAYGTLYTVGSPNVRPTGQTLMAGLRRVGFAPVRAVRAEDDAPDTADPDYDRGRRYLVALEDGSPLDVTVVDREQQAHGFFYRVWRRLALRGINQRRSLQSLRQALEQEALLAYAAIAAGANAPKLIATSELGPDAVMLVYEHVEGQTLDSLPDEEITDELLRGAWQQVRALQSRRIAHRRLVGDALLVDRSGDSPRVFLTDLRGGEIAAGDLVLRMDVAQLLVTLALRVGPERAVRCALAVLGPDAVADSLPLLQPIALTRSTRATLKQLARERAQREREAVIAASERRKEAEQAAQAAQAAEDAVAARAATKAATKAEIKAAKRAEKKAIEEATEEAREEDLLSRIRQEVLLIRPQAPVEPVRLERIRARTLVSIIAAALAAYVLLGQISQVPLTDAIAEADWAWAIVAVLASALSYVAAGAQLAGFVPERLNWWRTVLAQLAGSFVKLVAPAAVGGVALNTRYLQKSGVRPGLAVASVGASQLVGLGSHITLLLVFGYITGTEKTPSLSPSRTVMAGLLTAGVLALVVTAIPALRKFVVTRVRSLFAGVVPRMLDVLQRPGKLVTGIGGTLMVTVTAVVCLHACVKAFGGDASYASIAVVYLAGNAVGSAVPTPGGVGPIEAALTVALLAAGVPGVVATPAVLLFRLLTFWLPVLPGWLSFTYLTRKGAL